jgi:hypothetical protein
MRLNRISWLANLSIALLGAACSATTSSPSISDAGRDSVPDFQTDSLAYTLRATSTGYEGRIGARFTNKTDGTAYFVNCQGGTGVELQKLIDGAWKSVWSPVLLLCLSPPIVVASGGKQDLAISVFGGFPGCHCAPQFSITDIPGVYRAVWTGAVSSYQTQGLPFGAPLPEEHRISNRFTIAVEPRPGS